MDYSIVSSLERLLPKLRAIVRSEPIVCGKTLVAVESIRGSNQGNCLSPHIILLCMISVTMIVRKRKDNLKLYDRQQSQLCPLVATVYTFCADIRMIFGLKKWVVLDLKLDNIKCMNSLRKLSMELISNIYFWNS